MEGNFETNGNNSSSMPINAGGQSFDSPQIPQSEANMPKMTWQDYLKDGVDKGYYKAETEGIFSMEEVMSDAQEKMENFDQQIMNIPGTAHDKLESMANMPDENSEDTDKEKQKNENMKSEQEDREELSFEQRVIELQSEALKHLAKSLSERGNKDSEEILKKLKKLMEELEESNNSNKDSLLGAILRVMLIFTNNIEKGEKQLEKEVKRAE